MRTAGRRPVITPRIIDGILFTQDKNEIEARLSMLLRTPTNASGTVQNTIIIAMKTYAA